MKTIKILLIILSISLLTSCTPKDTVPTDRWTESTITYIPSTDLAPDATETDDPTTQESTVPSVEYDDNGYEPAVLMYHLIMEEPYNNLEALFVRPDDFRAHITILKEEGYEFLFADDYNKTAKPSVMLTFDDGYEDNYTTMFPILKELNAKATVFLITDMIGTPGYMSKDQIKEMSDSGLVYFGCHTATHCDLSAQTEERVRSEFERSIAVIEEITGQPCKALAYPAGGQNPTVNAIAEEFFDYAYISRPVIPDGIQTDMKIPRYYISRGMGPKNVLNTIRP